MKNIIKQKDKIILQKIAGMRQAFSQTGDRLEQKKSQFKKI